MSAITHTLTTYDTVGIREDLSDLISDISPTEVPFSSNAGKRKKPTNTLYDWQQDALADVDINNAKPEGDDHTSFTATEQPVRVGNYCQISDKDVIVSGTQEVVDKAGRKSDLARAIARRGLELKRDIEATCLKRNTGASGSDPRRSATMLSYVQTNVSVGAGGANPSAPSPIYAGTRTDGTQRTFTEALLQEVIVSAYTVGMKIDGSVLMVGPKQKQVVSTFPGIATQFKNVPKGMATIVGAADVYVSDFGEITVVPNRFQRNRDAWLLDFDLIGFADLRPYHTIDLSKTGDSTKKLMLREWSLQVDNEAGQALVADLSGELAAS
jgi:hypothetical protein